MTSVAAHATDDVGREVTLFWAVVFAVSYLSAVLTRLVFVVTEGTVECGKLTELITLELVLTFGDRSGL